MTGLTVAFHPLKIVFPFPETAVQQFLLLRRLRAAPDGEARDTAPHIRSPGFLHVDGVLQDSRSRNLIHHFTVIFAAHASFVKVAVGRDGAEALVNQVYRDVQPGPLQRVSQQLGVLRGHAG